MNNSSSNPPNVEPNPNPNPQNKNNEKKNPPKWPPQTTTLLTPPQTSQIQQHPQQTNWHWPSMHPQQQFQHGCGQYGQHAPVRYFMMHPPPPIPVWQHKFYNGQQQNHQIHSQPTKSELPNHQNENWSSQEMRRLLNTQNEFIKELTKKTNELEGQKNDLEGQIKELWEKMETTENEERETNIKLEKKTAEFDELLAKIEMEKGQKVDQSTETDPTELVVERPLTLPSPELDPLADELENLKNELGIKNKLVKKMEAEMEKTTEELRKLMDAQNENKELAKKKESLENWEERMKAREQRFTEEKEFAIAQCRIEVDSRINQMEFQLLSKNTALESKDKEITRLRGLNRQLSKDLDDSKASRNRLLRDLQDMDSTKKKLLEEIWIEKEKLKKQADRCEQLNLELADKDGKIAEKDEELAAKNEEMEKMMEKHKIAMNSTLDAYKMALGQNDERVQKLRNEIEEKKKEIVEREEKWKLEEEENWQILMMAENEQDRLKKEIAKMKLEKEEWGDKEAKALANAKKYELKLAEANKEIGKLQSDVAKMESLVRMADKENKEKQKQLDKMEAEMEENKKKELILRIKKEIDQPPKSTFDEIIQAMDKTPTPTKRQMKKVGGGIGRGKKQQSPPQQCNNESDSDYSPPGAKKKRMAGQKNVNPCQSIDNYNSIPDCLPSTSSNLQPSKKPTKLHKTVGDEALMKIGTPAGYSLRQRGRTIGATPTKQRTTTKRWGQFKEQQQKNSIDLEQNEDTSRCEHWYSAECEKCKQRYGI